MPRGGELRDMGADLDNDGRSEIENLMRFLGTEGRREAALEILAPTTEATRERLRTILADTQTKVEVPTETKFFHTRPHLSPNEPLDIRDFDYLLPVRLDPTGTAEPATPGRRRNHATSSSAFDFRCDRHAFTCSLSKHNSSAVLIFALPRFEALLAYEDDAPAIQLTTSSNGFHDRMIVHSLGIQRTGSREELIFLAGMVLFAKPR